MPAVFFRVCFAARSTRCRLAAGLIGTSCFRGGIFVDILGSHAVSLLLREVFSTDMGWEWIPDASGEPLSSLPEL